MCGAAPCRRDLGSAAMTHLEALGDDAQHEGGVQDLVVQGGIQAHALDAGLLRAVRGGRARVAGRPTAVGGCAGCRPQHRLGGAAHRHSSTAWVLAVACDLGGGATRLRLRPGLTFNLVQAGLQLRLAQLALPVAADMHTGAGSRGGHEEARRR